MAIPLLFKDIHMKEQATLVARCTDEQTWLHRARLEALYDDDREITAETFFRHVSLQEVSECLGYAFAPQKGLHLKDDYHVSYHRSMWRSVPCYHLEWSGIDLIYVIPDNHARMNDRAFFN
jgi:hypothetical protein